MIMLFSHSLLIRRLVCGGVMAVTILFSLTAVAGTSLNRGFDKLLLSSDQVVYGQFTETQSVWKGNKIITLGHFEVEEVIKGSQQTFVEVEMMGGTALHPRLKVPVTMKASDGVNFAAGERAVLLLRNTSGKTYQIVGMNSGKMLVLDDPATGEKLVSGMKKIKASKPDANSGTTTVAAATMTLSEFIEFSRSLMAKHGVKK